MSELVERLKTYSEFVRGTGSLEGFWFGERHTQRAGLYWWRKLCPLEEVVARITALEAELDASQTKLAAQQSGTGDTAKTEKSLKVAELQIQELEQLSASRSIEIADLKRQLEAKASDAATRKLRRECRGRPPALH